jgi:hypothetical protein
LAKPEKADLLAAMRRFDQALEEYISIIADPQLARSQQIIWQRAVSRALALAVRVKKDPDQAMSIVQTAESVKSAPDFFKEQLTGWKKSVESWKKEAPRKTLSEEGLFAEATRLTQEGKALQKYPADNAADVVYLRATAAVHDLLREYPKSTHSSEALLLAGISYEVLNDPLTWPIHETYYEACIRNKPNTEISATCFNRFEKSVYFGYSGSGGVSIPGDIDTLLKELKGLAVAKEEK